MDHRRFDSIATALAASASRRGAVAALMAALGLAVGDHALAGKGGGGRDGGKRHGRNRGNGHGNGRNRKGKRNGRGNAGRPGNVAPGQTDCAVCASGCPFTSVQAAIDAATAGDTIAICPGEYKENLTIGKDLTLLGSQGTAVTGLGDSSVVTVLANVTAAIRKVAIGLGAGTALNGNTRFGGGILVYDGADLTLMDAIVSANAADQGGGIYTFGRVTLDGGLVDDNRADDAGGGVYVNGQGELTVTGAANIEENTANRGGGIYNDGAAVSVNGKAQVSGNSATGDGGGIYNAGQLAIDAGIVRGNTAAGNGGGLFNQGQSTVAVQNGAVVTRNAAANGAGVYNGGDPGNTQPTLSVIDSAITRNQASGVGGGVYNDAGVVTMRAGTVTNNTATATGGGVFNTDAGTVTFDAESAVIENNPNNCIGTTDCPA